MSAGDAPPDGALLCRCRGLTWGLVRQALAAGARSLGEVRAHCAGSELPEALRPPPGGDCCTARLAGVIRRGRGQGVLGAESSVPACLRPADLSGVDHGAPHPRPRSPNQSR